MPKQRLQVEPSIPSPRLRPAAQVQDSFVPQQGAGSQAAQLAQALSRLEPGLAQLGNQLFERNTKKNLESGAEAARETIRQLDESRTTYADAVRTGKIPAHMNPWMKQGYYEELGRTYAGRLQADLTSAIQQDENLKNTVEMSDYRAFTSKFEQQWLETNVPKDVRNQAFGVGYGSRRDAILTNMEAGWSASTEQRFTQRSLAMFRDESVQFIQEALDQNRSPEDIGKFLRQMWDDKHGLGWDGRLTGNTLVDAITDVALARQDPELLDELLNAVPGGDGKSANNRLGRTSYAIEKAEDMRGAIFTARRRGWEQQDRERTEAVRGITAEAATRFEDAQSKHTDRNAVPIDDLQRRAIALGDVAASDRIQTMKEAYQNDEFSDDKELVADFLLRLHRAPGALTQQALDYALRAKRLSLQTYHSISNELEQSERQGSRKAFLEDDPYHEYGEKSVAGYFGTSPDADTPEVAYRRQQAKRQFSEWYIRTFLVEGAPKANVSGMERRRMIDAESQDLARSWVPYEDAFSGTFRLSGEDFDWGTRPVDIPDRIEPMLDELEGFYTHRLTGRPSPALLSLLNVWGVDLSNRQEMKKFLDAQRSFITSPVTNAKPK